MLSVCSVLAVRQRCWSVGGDWCTALGFIPPDLSISRLAVEI